MLAIYSIFSEKGPSDLMKLVILFLVVVSCSAFSQSQFEMNQTEFSKFKKADSTLQAVYSEILREYKTDTLFLAKLEIAQSKWIQLREADLAALYPDTTSGAYGSVNPMCQAIFLTDRTQERTEYLKQWVSKTEEGDVCAGTIGIK